MTTGKNLPLAAALLLAATGLACGSGSGTAGDGGGVDIGTAIGGGTLTWKEGGTTHTGQIATASIVRDAQLDLLEIGGADPKVSVALGVSMGPPPLTTGTYNCGGTTYPIVSFSYTGTGADGTKLTCTIDLTAVGFTSGAHAVGTFSASFGLTGGGMGTVTDGRFDIPAIVNGP